MRRWSTPCRPNDAAGEERDARLVEQPVGELVGSERQLGDVREGVEGTARLDAANARDLVQRGHEVVAAPAELGHHRGDGVLRPLERCDARELGERRHARGRVHDQAHERIDELLRHGRVAHPPAGHGERLREAVEHERALEHPGHRRDRRGVDVVRDAPVHLVTQHPRGCLEDRGGGPPHVGLRDDTAGRVLRRVEDDEAGAVAEQRVELVGVEAEPPLLAQRQRHRRRTGEADGRLVDREARVGVDHLVTRPGGGEDGEEEERLRTGRDENALGIDGQAARRGDRRRRGLPQHRQPGRLAVMRLARPDRRDPCLRDMLRRLEVGLADLEVDDVPPGRLERTGPREHRERALRAEAPDCLCHGRPHRAATLHRAAVLDWEVWAMPPAARHATAGWR